MGTTTLAFSELLNKINDVNVTNKSSLMTLPFLSISISDSPLLSIYAAKSASVFSISSTMVLLYQALPKKSLTPCSLNPLTWE
jgi:hypothetical protein